MLAKFSHNEQVWLLCCLLYFRRRIIYLCFANKAEGRSREIIVGLLIVLHLLMVLYLLLYFSWTRLVPLLLLRFLLWRKFCFLTEKIGYFIRRSEAKCIFIKVINSSNFLSAVPIWWAALSIAIVCLLVHFLRLLLYLIQNEVSHCLSFRCTLP